MVGGEIGPTITIFKIPSILKLGSRGNDQNLVGAAGAVRHTVTLRASVDAPHISSTCRLREVLLRHYLNAHTIYSILLEDASDLVKLSLFVAIEDHITSRNTPRSIASKGPSMMDIKERNRSSLSSILNKDISHQGNLLFIETICPYLRASFIGGSASSFKGTTSTFIRHFFIFIIRFIPATGLLTRSATTDMQ